MFRNKLESAAFALFTAGAYSMILIPALVVNSGYSMILAAPHPPQIQELQVIIALWVTAGVIAILADSVFVAVAGLRKIVPTFLAFSSLVYWSGLFDVDLTFSVTDRSWFAWPPVLIIAGILLAWISRVGNPLSRGFWLTLVGGCLMVSLSVPPLLIDWGYVRAQESPYTFLGIGSMAFGGLLVVLVSLRLALFPASHRFARNFSLLGIVYYLGGLIILLVQPSYPPTTIAGGILSNFEALGVAFALPAIAGMFANSRADGKA